MSVLAQKKLLKEGIDVSVISMPSTELFDKQSNEYKEKVIPKSVIKRLVVEASCDPGLAKYYGTYGKALGINTFGICGDGQQVYEEFGYTVDNVVKEYKML